MSELLPCPFCGAFPHIGGSGRLDGFIESWVECAAFCGASVRKTLLLNRDVYSPQQMTDSELKLIEEAKLAWNTRAPLAPMSNGMDEWISIWDQHPPAHERVFIYGIGLSHHKSIDFATYDPDMPASMFWHGIEMGYGVGVTHWQPLPSPPKGATE